MSGTGNYSTYGKERQNNWNVQRELARFEMEYKAKHRVAALKEHRVQLFWAYAPLVLLVIYILLMIIMMFANIDTLAMDNRQFVLFYMLVLSPGVMCLVTNAISTVMFVVKVCKNPNFGTGKKVLWSIALVDLNLCIFPVYFHKYILYDKLEREKEKYKCVLEGKEPIEAEKPFWEERRSLLTEEEATELAEDTYVYNSSKGHMNGKQALVHAFLPLILGVIWLVSYIHGAKNIEYVTNLSGRKLFFFAFAIYNFITSIRFIIMTAYREDMSKGEKVLWSIFLFTLNLFIFPVYWFLRVDKSDLFPPMEVGGFRINIGRIFTLCLAFVPFVIALCYTIINAYWIGTFTDDAYINNDLTKSIFILFVISVILNAMIFSVFVIRNERLSGAEKIIWVFLLLIFNIVTFPLYWNRYISIKKEEAGRRKELLFLSICPGVLCVAWGLLLVLFVMFLFFLNGVITLLLLITNLMTFVMYILAAIVFIFEVSNNYYMSIGKKVFWSICIGVFGLIACPVYWVLHIRINKMENGLE